MKADAIKLDGKKAGSVELPDAIFGLEPRADILHRVVRWQRNNAQAGTHKRPAATATICPRRSASWASCTRCRRKPTQASW